MNYKIKKAPIIAVVCIVGALFGGRYAYTHGYLGPSSAGSAAVPVVADLPEFVDGNATAPSTPNVGQVALPSNSRAAVNAPEIRFQQMAWNSQTGLNFANGGVYTTQGSLMQKHGVNLRIVWEDDVNKQMTALVNFAKELKSNPQPTEGAHFAALMGDGTGAMLGGITKELADLGVEAEIIGSAGYSRGEDQLMGPPEWKTNPRLALGGRGNLPPDAQGGLVAAFLRDGDWNIVLKWAGDNGLKNNPDEKTYDPSAINWYSADDYIKAAEAYISGVCEERPVVINGKRNGETAKVCVNAVTTWTPGDVNVAEQKGGLATIVSTEQYRSQMPNTIIGIKQWNQANSKLVVEFLAAMFEGGDQVKTYPQALQRGAQANSEIWGGQKPADYWVTYFKGVTKRDKQGVEVKLGGSAVNNLNDNLALFGLLPGQQASPFNATYNVFAKIVKQQYPRLVPDIPEANKVVNTAYVLEVQKKYGSQLTAAADLPKFNPGQVELKNVVSQRSWQINFDTGKASFAPESKPQLGELRDGLMIAGDLAVEIIGHTDNTGDPERNRVLSQQRANAVKNWLMQQSPTDFSTDRFLKVTGMGSDKPAKSNDTETGRAANRRVEVRLGN